MYNQFRTIRHIEIQTSNTNVWTSEYKMTRQEHDFRKKDTFVAAEQQKLKARRSVTTLLMSASIWRSSSSKAVSTWTSFPGPQSPECFRGVQNFGMTLFKLKTLESANGIMRGGRMRIRSKQFKEVLIPPSLGSTLQLTCVL